MRATLEGLGATHVVTEEFARTPAMKELCMCIKAVGTFTDVLVCLSSLRPYLLMGDTLLLLPYTLLWGCCVSPL